MLPKVIYIETTNLCNAKCIMCPHERITRNPPYMKDEVFDKIVGELEKNELEGTQIFLHKEGEPLMDPKLMDRLTIVASKFAHKNEVGISTNAMLFSKKIADKFIDTGANMIFFSIDGVEKEEYERIRVNLKYDIVEQNIKYFLQRCKDEKLNIRVVMQMLIQSENNSSEKFIELWKQYPCEFYIKEMHSYLDGGHSSQTSCIGKSQINLCDDPFRLIVIYTNGNAGLCCWDYNNEYCIGNIMESSLYELFNGKKANNLRNAIVLKKCKKIVPCNRCAKVFGNDHITSYK